MFAHSRFLFRSLRRFLQARSTVKAGHPRPRLLGVETLEDRTLPSVNLGTNFIGLNINDTPGYEPPDTIAAAGPNHVVELVNTDMRIFNKTGGVISTQDLGTFFTSLHPQSLSDPAVMFDDTISN